MALCGSRHGGCWFLGKWVSCVAEFMSLARFALASVCMAVLNPVAIGPWNFGSGLTLIDQPALANPPNLTLELPIYTLTEQRDLVAQAERMAQAAIAREFQQKPALSMVQVVVLGNRHGNLVPILTVSVTRSQWQQNPRVSAWTQYYASGRLLQRPDPQPAEPPDSVVAAQPANPTQSGQPETGPRGVGGRGATIDQAWDTGQMTRSQAQDYLSDLD